MATHGLQGLLGALRDLGKAFEEASAEQAPLLHELLVARYPRDGADWWERFLADSYYPRPILGPDGNFYLTDYPASERGEDWHEVFPDGERCSRYFGHREGLETFARLAAHGYELMRAVASNPRAAATELAAAVRDPGFRPTGHGKPLPYKVIPSEARFPYEERGKFGWLGLVYSTAGLYPTTCRVTRHMFGDLDEERRAHHHSPDVYNPASFATEFNIEVYGGIETDVFNLSATVIDLWLSPPRPVEVAPPTPINLWELAGDTGPADGNVEAADAVTRPTWDPVARELRWGRDIVKRFTKPAENQTTILAVFEEEGWPPVIDDPLPGGGMDSAKRLGDTVRALNQNMLKPRIEFYRMGVLGRVYWRRV